MFKFRHVRIPRREILSSRECNHANGKEINTTPGGHGGRPYSTFGESRFIHIQKSKSASAEILFVPFCG